MRAKLAWGKTPVSGFPGHLSRRFLLVVPGPGTNAPTLSVLFFGLMFSSCN